MSDVIQKVRSSREIRHGLASVFLPGSGMNPGFIDANRILGGIVPIPTVIGSGISRYETALPSITVVDAKYTERFDIDGKINKGGFETIVMDNATASGLVVPDGAALAVVSNDGGSIRWRDDGTSPTTLLGHVLGSGENLTYDGELDSIEFIAKGADDGVLTVSYYTLRNATN